MNATAIAWTLGTILLIVGALLVYAGIRIETLDAKLTAQMGKTVDESDRTEQAWAEYRRAVAAHHYERSALKAYRKAAEDERDAARHDHAIALDYIRTMGPTLGSDTELAALRSLTADESTGSKVLPLRKRGTQ